MEWNDSNTDLTHPFLKEAFQQKKWAFVSDFIRIKKLIEFGGIYLDTDMLFIKPFDQSFLKHQYFMGMEDSQSLSAGVIGSEQNGEFFQMVLQYYNKIEKFEQLTIPYILNEVYRKYFGQNTKPGQGNGGLILPYPVFYPLPFKLKKFHWRKFVVEETMAVHLWAGSWLENQKSSLIEKWIDNIKYLTSRYYVPNSLINYSKSI